MTTTRAGSMGIPILLITSLKSISLSAGLPVWLFRMRLGDKLGVTLRTVRSGQGAESWMR
jgi:hypothetical protein